jgi:large subunit ribosomal protein L18
MSKQARAKRKGRETQRRRRHRRIRKRIHGSAERPRLVIHRSLKNVEGQIVDDDAGRTLVGLSTRGLTMDGFESESSNPAVERAHEAGKRLAAKAIADGIDTVVFDRGGYKYHGRVKAFAEGAREGGLKF